MSSAGQRTKLVTLESPVTAPDGEGGTTETWVALTPPTAYVHIQPASAADLERAAAGTVLSTASHLIEMPYHAGVTIESRLRYTPPGKAERIFQVTSVRNPDEADRDLILVAEEQL
jgi:head-tail adaptor